ncbi:MAG: hypothetical protein HLUCCA12_17225 [Rhodobacteraceae bacterium HLUCCA12]|nr:MAG: hypothetical protein HLUCCA12_17225 [Rhodobacteraceae bacterium HLUCCA12]
MEAIRVEAPLRLDRCKKRGHKPSAFTQAVDVDMFFKSMRPVAARTQPIERGAPHRASEIPV